MILLILAVKLYNIFNQIKSLDSKLYMEATQ